MRIRFLPVIAVMVLIAGAGLYRLVESSAGRNRVELLRDSVQALRTASDACTSGLRWSQEELVLYRARLDSLYEEVRDFEAVELGGVPAEQYTEYMTRFVQYRDSAAAWDGRVESVRGMLDECRSLAELHNQTVDSLRAAYDAQR